MPLVVSISFVFLKVVIGDTLIFFWLWLARDRGGKGRVPLVDLAAVLLFWLLPWLAFLWRGSMLAGECTLSRGFGPCAIAEFVGSELGWVRFGLWLDTLLFAAILFGVKRLQGRLEAALNLGHPTKGSAEAG